MKKARILAFAGSARRESYNKKLVRIAAAGAESAGAYVTTIDLADYPLPLFNADLEEAEGIPENVTKLKRLFLDNDGLLIASPEYNSSITPLFKNTIDWVSRAADGESPLAAYRDKCAVLMSASPGGLGGLRGLVHARAMLANIGVLVLPDQVALPRAHQAFDESGRLKDDEQRSKVEALGRNLAELISKLRMADG